MRELLFNCTFLSDVVLNARTATEGSPECLDFVPGSNFLGIVARDYGRLHAKDLAYRLFHSGETQFGDAHPLVQGQRALRMPCAWFVEKGRHVTDAGRVWVHHELPRTQQEQHREQGPQLKQVRSGFFLPGDGTVVRPESFFAIKAAHDRTTRRAKDGKLFGYEALRRGSTWQFSVRLPDEDRLEEAVTSRLAGEHGIGRSRSAQYGRAEIVRVDEAPPPRGNELELEGTVALYAESRWALADAYGQPTMRLAPAALGLPDGVSILWEKSQIRTVVYAPWNAKRRSRDADRLCIEKGSVLVVKWPNDADDTGLSHGIGYYRPEGLGRVLVDPTFLKAKPDGRLDLELKKWEPAGQSESRMERRSRGTGAEAAVLGWLTAQGQYRKRDRDVLQYVNAFVDKQRKSFAHISPSQWGLIRSTASRATDVADLCDRLFEEELGLLMHGVSEKTWQKNGARDKLESELKDRRALGPIYAVRLAAAMQQAAQGKES